MNNRTILKNLILKISILFIFIFTIMIISEQSLFANAYTWIGNFYSPNATTTSDPSTMSVNDVSTWWLEVQLYEKDSSGCGVQICYTINDGSTQYAALGYDHTSGNNDYWNNHSGYGAGPLGPHAVNTKITWWVQGWDDWGNTSDVWYNNSGNNYVFIISDDDASAPTYTSYSDTAVNYNSDFVIAIYGLSDATGISTTRSKAYFSWTANPGPSNYFTSVYLVQVDASTTYTFTCSKSVASNLFTSNIGKVLYWSAIIADSDADAGAGDNDSTYFTISNQKTILPQVRDIVINEIGFFGTSTASSGGDYLELYNRSGYTIYTDSMWFNTTRQIIRAKATSASISNGSYYLMEDLENISTAASDSLIVNTTFGNNDTIILMFDSIEIDSAKVTTGLGYEGAASFTSPQVAMERYNQSGYGFDWQNWRSAAKVYVGNARASACYLAGTPKAANTDYSSNVDLPIYISEIMYSTVANYDSCYIELYNAGTDTYVMYKWSLNISATKDVTTFSQTSLIFPNSYFLIEDTANATTITGDLSDAFSVSLVSSSKLKKITLYGGAYDTCTVVDTAGDADQWYTPTSDISVEKSANHLTSSETIVWGNHTGTDYGGVHGSPKTTNGYVYVSNYTPTVSSSNICWVTSSFDTLLAGKQFQVKAVYSDADGAADLLRFYLRIGNGTDTIAMNIDRPAAGASATIYTGSDYVKSATVDTKTASPTATDVTCTWTITLDWDFVEASNYKIGIMATDDQVESSSWADTTTARAYENDLILSGTLTNDKGITNGGWTKASQSVTWSGLTVYYQGTTVSPGDADFDIRLTSQTGTTDQTTGAALSKAVTTRATSGTDYCTATVINIPSGGSFASGTAGMTFNVDADNPTITVNAGEDSRVIKSITGAMYGSLFNIDFSDATSHIDTAYVWLGANTQAITTYGGASWTTNWAINETVFGGLSSGNNAVNVTVYDSAGNRTNQTIYIAKETITINGDTTDWQSDELLESRNNNSFYTAWDDTCFYIAYGGVNGSLDDCDFFVYLQTSSVIAADSSYTTINWGAEGTHTLPFGANYAICFENGSWVEFQKTSSGSWSNISNASAVDSSVYGGWSSTPRTEYRINWNAFGGKPTSLKAVAFHQWDTAINVYNSFPTGNPAPNDGSTVTFTKYYSWSDMTDTVAPNSGVPTNHTPTVTITAPTAGSETTATVRFSWTYSDADADAQNQYNIQFSTANTFSTILCQDTKTSANAYYDSDLAGRRGTYYWRVRAYDGTAWGSFSTGDSSFILIAGNNNTVEQAGLALEPDSTVPGKSYRYFDTSGQESLGTALTQNGSCTITIRAYKNDLTAAFIRVWWDNYDYPDGESIYTMTKSVTSGIYDYWSGTIPAHSYRANHIYYRVYATDGTETNTISAGGTGGTEYGVDGDTWYIVDSQDASGNVLDDYYSVVYKPGAGDIKITEVMSNAQNDNYNDFVEIYNNSISTIDLNIVSLSDNAATEVLQIANLALTLSNADTTTTLLGPGKFAVVVETDYLSGEIYAFPSNTLIVTPGNSTIGSGGLTPTENVYIYYSSILIDSFPFASDPGDAISWERTDTTTNNSSVWVASTIDRGVYNGTPGEKYDTCASAPTGLSPTAGAAQNTLPPTLSWTHNDNAGSWTTQVRFQIQIDTLGTFASATNFVDTTVSSTSSSRTIGANFVRNTNYYWRVRTWSRADFCDTGVWSVGTDTFSINRIIIDADTQDWYGSTSVDADKDKWNTIKVCINEQSGTATSGGKFFWRDSFGGDGDDGDASTEGSYAGNNVSAHDLKYFSMTMDNNNLYFLVELVDLRDDIPVLIQIALDVADNAAIDSSIYFHGTGVATKDVKVTENSKWEYLVQFYNGDGDKIYVTTPQAASWQDTNITSSSTYSEHINNNIFEVAVPLSSIGGSAYYLNRSSSNPLKISVAVFRANTSSAPAVPSDFNKNLGGSDYNVPQAVDCISDLPYNYNGSYDPQQHELGPNDQTISYNIITSSSNGNVQEVTTVSSGKALDGNLGDWIVANERMEVSQGDTLWIAFGDENMNIGLEGFDFTGANHFGIIFDTSANTGCTVGIGGPKFDTSYTPDVLVIVEDGSNASYYKPQADGKFGGKTALTSAQFYLNTSNNNTLEMAIPRTIFGLSSQSTGVKIMAFTSEGANIYGCWPVTNPIGVDSSAITFIGAYYYDSTTQNAKTNNAIDTNSPPVFILTMKSTPHYDSNSDSSDADTSTWYDSSLLSDSFGVVLNAADTVSAIADSGIYIMWHSTTSADNKEVRLAKTATSYSFDIKGNTNGIITLVGWARNNYGLQSYDTVIFGFDNVGPSVPTKIYPAAQSDTIGTNNIIRFDWTDSADTLFGTTSGSGIKQYYIWISTNSSFSDTVYGGWTAGTTSETTYNFSAKSDAIYYWKVYGIDNVSNTSGWSTADTFYFSHRPGLVSWSHDFRSGTVAITFDRAVDTTTIDTNILYIQKTPTTGATNVTAKWASISPTSSGTSLTITLPRSTCETIATWETSTISLSFDTDFIKSSRAFGCTQVQMVNAVAVSSYVTGYDTAVKINEVYIQKYNTTADTAYIELYFLNDIKNGWKDLKNWQIKETTNTRSFSFNSRVNLGPGDFLKVMSDGSSANNQINMIPNTADTGIYFAGKAIFYVTTTNEVALYNDTPTATSANIIDYVIFSSNGGDAPNNLTNATTAGLWASATDSVVVSTNETNEGSGYSIQLKSDGIDTSNSSVDWKISLNTPNASNINYAPIVYASNIVQISGYDTLLPAQQYKVRVTYSDTNGYKELLRYDFRINNGSDAIWYYTLNNATPVAAAGSEYISSISVDTTMISTTTVYCTWTFTPNWNFVRAGNYVYGARASDRFETGSWTDSTINHSYENRLILSGTLSGTTPYSGIITTDTFVRGGETIYWSGLTAYYQGTTISPSTAYCTFVIRNSAGDTWAYTTSTSLTYKYSKAKSTSTNSDSVDIYISQLPAAFSDTKTSVTFKVDATNPAAPTLNYPENQGDTKGTSGIVRFDWDGYDTADFPVGASGISKYYITVDTAGTFTAPCFSGYTSSSISETTYNFASMADTIYYWKVYGIDNVSNTSGWSTADTFYFSHIAALTSWSHDFRTCTVSLTFDRAVDTTTIDTTQVYIQKIKPAAGASDSVQFTGASVIPTANGTTITLTLTRTTANTIAGWETGYIYLSYTGTFIKSTRGFYADAVASANAVAVSSYVTGYDTDIVINEIYYYPATGDKEWLELYHKGSAGWKNLNGWVLRYDGNTKHTFTESVIIGPGDYLVISNASGTNDTDLTQGSTGTGIIYKNTADYMSNEKGDLQLYNSSTFNQWTIVDFVAWGGDDGEYDDTAVTAGIWTNGAYISVVSAQGYSTGRYPNGQDNNTTTEWYEFPITTPDSANGWYGGIGIVTITSPDSGIGLRSELDQSVTFGVKSIGASTIDTVIITIPPQIGWSSSASNILISGAGAGTPADTTISGAGTLAEPYTVALKGLAITASNTVSITIKSFSYNGGGLDTAITGLFTFTFRTGTGNSNADTISSSPYLAVLPKPSDIVISEIFTHGTGDGDWCELYNTTSKWLSLYGLKIDADNAATVYTFTAADSIAPFSYFLIADDGYAGQADVVRTTFTLAAADDGLKLYRTTAVNTTYIIDAAGWGAAGSIGTGRYEGTPIQAEDGDDSSYERLSIGATDGTNHSEYGGNGKDTNNNDTDFYVRTIPDPQNSSSNPEVPPGYSPDGSANISPSNKVAAAGVGEWDIIYSCGSELFVNGTIKVGIPAGWTQPQNTVATDAGYVYAYAEGSGASIGAVNCSNETITISNVNLSDSTNKVHIKYGWTNSGTNKGAVSTAPSATGSYTIDVEVDVDGSATANLTYGQPSLTVAAPASWTSMDPGCDPTSFKGSEYQVIIKVIDANGNALYGCIVTADSISSPGDSGTLSEYSTFNNGSGHYKNSYTGSGSGDTVVGWTNSDGKFYVTLTTSPDSGLNQFRFYNATLGETIYKDTTRDPYPLISEIAWDGVTNGYEYIEIFNPLSTSVDLTGYHIGDDGGTNTVVAESVFNGQTLTAYGYAIIFQDGSPTSVANATEVNTNAVVLNSTFSSGFADAGESVTIYRDGATNTFVDRHYKSTSGWWGGVDGSNYSMERLWVTRSGDLSGSWGTSSAGHLYNIGGTAKLGKGTPGYANSIALYNSTLNEGDSLVGGPNFTDSTVYLYVTLVLNDSRPVRTHKVWLRSSRDGIDTIVQPFNYKGGTSDTGWTCGYIYSTTSGTATIYVDTPAGVTDTAYIMFDFDGPVFSSNWAATPSSNSETTTASILLDWADAADTLSGVKQYRIQIAGDPNFNVLLADSYTNNTTSNTTATFSDSIYYWRVCSQDNQTNWGSWTNYDTFTIRYNSPIIKITNPADYDETTVSSTTISGTTYYSCKYDTIYLYVKGETQGAAISLTGYGADWSGPVALTGNNDVIVAKIIDKFGRAAYDTITLNNWASDTTLRINEIMFTPPLSFGDTRGDWIELYNDTSAAVNIKDWQIRIASTAAITMSSSDYYIPAYSYLILAADTSSNGLFSSTYNYNINDSYIQISSLDLAREASSITIINANKYIVDKISYNASWGGGATNYGKTLERINPDGAKTDANFDTTTLTYGTPGAANSVSVYNSFITDGLAVISDDTSSKTTADTLADIRVIMLLSNRDPVRHHYVIANTTEGTFTNNSGSANYGTSYYGITNDSGYIIFYLKSSSVCTAIITASCTECGYALSLTDTGKVQFVNYIAANNESWDTIFTADTITVSQDTFLMEPVFGPSGTEIAYFGKYGADTFDLWKMDISTNPPVKTKLADGNKLRIDNMSRISWGYCSGGETYILMSGWDVVPNGVDLIKPKIFAIKTDGTNADLTQSDLFGTIQDVTYNSATGQRYDYVQSADVLYGTDTIVMDYNHQYIGVYNKTSWKNKYIIPAALLRENNIYSAVGEPRWNPEGTAITFIKYLWDNNTLPFGHPSVTTVNRSECWVLTDVDKILNGTQSAPASWSDARLVKISGSNKLCYHPNWNSTGDVVSWSQDDTTGSGANMKTLLDAKYNGNSVFSEFNKADFNVYKRSVDVASRTTTTDSLVEDNSAGNQFALSYSHGSASGQTVNIEMDSGQIMIMIRHLANSAQVTENGGIIFDHGKTSIVVPKGEEWAVNTLLGVDEPASVPSGDSDGIKIVTTGAAREFWPNGQQFSTNVEIILYYTDADLVGLGITNNTEQENYLKIYYYNPTTKTWEKYDGIVDPADALDGSYRGKIKIYTNHFSLYAIGFAPELSDTLSTIVLAKNNIIYEYGETVAFSIYTRDVQGNPLGGVIAYCTATPAVGLTIVQDTTKSSADGIITGYLRADTNAPTSYSIKIVNDAGGALCSNTVPLYIISTVQLINDTNSSISVSKLTAKTEGEDSIQITVTLLDSNNNPVKSVSGKITIENMTENDTVSPAGVQLSDTLGIIKANFTSRTAGIKIIKFVNEQGAKLISDTVIINIVTPSQLINDAYSNINISKDTAVADGIDSVFITVTFLDSDSNGISSVFGKITLENLTSDDTITPSVIQASDSRGQLTARLVSTGTGEKIIKCVNEVGTELLSKTGKAEFYENIPPVIRSAYATSVSTNTAPNVIKSGDTIVNIYCYSIDNAGTGYITLKADLSDITGDTRDVDTAVNSYDSEIGLACWSNVKLKSSLNEGDSIYFIITAKDRNNNTSTKKVYVKVSGNYKIITGALSATDTTQIEISSSDLKGKLKIKLNDMLAPSQLASSKTISDTQNWVYLIKFDRIVGTRRAIGLNKSLTYFRTDNLAIKIPLGLEYAQYDINVSLVNISGDSEIVLTSGDNFLQPGKFVGLEVNYPSTIDEITASKLKFYYYDMTNNYFDEQQTSVDINMKKVNVELTHFSIYVLAMAIPLDLSKLKIYPNPWTPYSIRDGIYFDNIPEGTAIKIYNIAGDLVDVAENLNDGGAKWNLRNHSGEKVASGIYIYVIEAKGDRKIGKVSVVK